MAKSRDLNKQGLWVNVCSLKGFFMVTYVSESHQVKSSHRYSRSQSDSTVEGQ